MSANERFREGMGVREELAGIEDLSLNEALQEFRSSVHAWSEAAYGRPLTAVRAAPRAWRLATGWALGCALVAGGVSAGIYERQHRRELARIAAAQMAERENRTAADRAREEEELLARVDSDVSREVPKAMEPLAQLMAMDENR